MKKILLVEPQYRNKYPPLGLMKISTYHKSKCDQVVFIKGKNTEIKAQKWDRIYISTLFTFYWKITVDTIKYYSSSITENGTIYVGGVLATLMSQDLQTELKNQKVLIVKGLLNRAGILDNDDIIIDSLVPDYSIIDMSTNPLLNYQYPIKNAYITYMTRGCIRKCSFCAVPTLEPEFNNYLTLWDNIATINQYYGEKKNLMLLDNNILASSELELIVEELCELGYYRNNKSYNYQINGKTRRATKYIDFNQGTDARLLDEDKVRLLSRLEIRPLRIAFDNFKEKDVTIYKNAMLLAAKYEFKTLSNYMLFNYMDKPSDLYNRILTNIELNEHFQNYNQKTSIWCFPMKYSPISGDYSKNRKYIGRFWTKKQLRAIQCILNATHGVVGAKRPYFEHAFGKDIKSFELILQMPEKYILNRKKNEENGNINLWKSKFEKLSKNHKEYLIELIKDNVFSANIYSTISIKEIREMYKLYLDIHIL